MVRLFIEFADQGMRPVGEIRFGRRRHGLPRSWIRSTQLALLISLSLSLSHSQDQRRPPEFRHFTVANGLSHSQVNAIAQDHQGFIWIGTRAGLDRFDGYRCTVFTHDPDDSTSVSGDFILSLLVTRDGLLWVGTQGHGLNCYDPRSGNFTVYGDKPRDALSDVVVMLEDNEGTLWAGTTEGLFILMRDSGNIVQVQPVHDSASAPGRQWGVVRALHEARDGTIWVGTEKGVYSLSAEERRSMRFVAYAHKSSDPASLGEGIVHCITSDRNRGVWIGTRRGSVRRFDVASRRIEQFLPTSQEKSICSDAAGNLWVGTLDNGIYRISPGDAGGWRIVNYRHNPDDDGSPGGNDISCIFQDRSGRLWFGTNGAGISVLDPLARKFAHVHHVPYAPHSLSMNLVKGMAVDRENNLWVGTQGGGLDVFPRGSDQCEHVPTTGEEERDNLVSCVLARRNGEVWAAYSFGGVVRIMPDRKHHIHYRHTPGDPSGLVGINVVRAMFEDSRGDVWIGTHGFGLLRFDDRTGRFTRYVMTGGDKNILAANHVWAITEDHAGKLWLGYWRRGLDCLDPVSNTVRHFSVGADDSSALGDHPIVSMLEDRARRLWIATAGGGLEVLNPEDGQVQHFDLRHGFPDNMVYGILRDRHDALWLSTGKGLVRFEPATGKTRVFDVHDGVQSTEFSQGACCATPDGWLAFGGINGFNWFHPDSVVLNNVPPVVVVTRFLVFDREVRLPAAITATDHLLLNRDQNFFSFEFAALDYTAPAKNQYAYRMEGFDRDWIQAGHRRLATYTNVGPGTYVFHVKASNNDGVWNDEGVSIAVTILPAFWETWWFRLLSASGLIALAFGIYRFRVNRLLAVQKTRERIARDLHDDVSAILSGISYFSRAVHEDRQNSLSDRSAHFMSLINRSSTEVLELLHDIIWSIHPDADTFESIAVKCRRFASELCESKSIHHTIDVGDALPSRPVDTERRKNLWLLYKEMVTNAVRHSGCTELRVRLGVSEKGIVHLVVEDNGKGFDPGSVLRESGLKNIRERAAMLAADLKLITEPGNGTQWELQCPLWK